MKKQVGTMDIQKVGNAISYLRKRAGYTQRDIADRIGISDKAVSKWERGLGLPDISYLGKLSILLDTDSDSLLAGDVIHHDIRWHGVLILSNNSYGIDSSTIIFDKPLVYYLLSYFLLVGIKRILIVCSPQDIMYISSEFGDGRKLGIELICCELGLKKAIEDNYFNCSNAMIVFGRSLIYGVDQTRFFQRALTNKDRMTILAMPQKANLCSNRIIFDENKKVVNSNDGEPIRTQYDYCHIPVLFCPKKNIFDIAFDADVSLYLSTYAAKNELYAEILDRGFVEIPIDTWDDVHEASTFVKIVQKVCGMNIYCIEEVAWRRGMINKEQLRSLGKQKSDTEYGRYILSLCEKI